MADVPDSQDQQRDAVYKKRVCFVVLPQSNRLSAMTEKTSSDHGVAKGPRHGEQQAGGTSSLPVPGRGKYWWQSTPVTITGRGTESTSGPDHYVSETPVPPVELEEVRFRCQDCSKKHGMDVSFHSEDALAFHNAACHEPKTLPCRYPGCRARFSRQFLRAEHVKCVHCRGRVRSVTHDDFVQGLARGDRVLKHGFLRRQVPSYAIGSMRWNTTSGIGNIAEAQYPSLLQCSERLTLQQQAISQMQFRKSE